MQSRWLYEIGFIRSYPAEINLMSDSSGADPERFVIDRCLQGDEGAWRDLYENQRPRLMHNLRRLLRHQPFRLRQIDDIIAEVWCSLCVNRCDRLRRYNPDRTALSTYLTALAMQQVWLAERREARRAVELPYALRGHEPVLARRFERPTELLIEELCSILPPGHADFLRQLLWPERGIGPMRSKAASRQMRHRVMISVRFMIRR